MDIIRGIEDPPPTLIRGSELWYESLDCFIQARKEGYCHPMTWGGERPAYCHQCDDSALVCPYYREAWDEE